LRTFLWLLGQCIECKAGIAETLVRVQPVNIILPLSLNHKTFCGILRTTNHKKVCPLSLCDSYILWSISNFFVTFETVWDSQLQNPHGSTKRASTKQGQKNWRTRFSPTEAFPKKEQNFFSWNIKYYLLAMGVVSSLEILSTSLKRGGVAGHSKVYQSVSLSKITNLISFRWTFKIHLSIYCRFSRKWPRNQNIKMNLPAIKRCKNCIKIQ